MNAEIIAVGSEMLTPEKVDTNSLWLTDQLNALGVEVAAKAIVGDDRDRLREAVAAAVQRSEIVILSGGLGPTEDDVTRDAVAQALGRGQTYRQDLCDAIAARFANMKRQMAENNKRQALLIDGFDPLDNDRGTAPGQWLRREDGRIVMLLPGPPGELKAMFARHCLGRLREVLPPLHIATVHYRVAGMGESDLDQLIAPVYAAYSNPVTTILASPGDVHVHLRARADNDEAARVLADEVGGKIAALLGNRIYSRDGANLETATGRALKSRGATVAVAESCTGGMLGARFTSVAGSSAYFAGGFITYTNALKIALLGVPESLIVQHTEVSEPVAAAMAAGAREKLGSTYALSVTGYAGPDGGTEANPVGTVFIGLAGPDGVSARCFHLFGDRDRIRSMASTTAINMLRVALL